MPGPFRPGTPGSFIGSRRERAALFMRLANQENVSVPVLPEDDSRAVVPVVWAVPLVERLFRLNQAGHEWERVSPRACEEVVAELFDGFGYQVELTKRTRDGGRDVVAIRHTTIKSDKYLIECKHWRDKVGIGVVRELLGVGAEEPHSGLILASTSGFTADSKLFAERERVRWTLSLKDRDDINVWVEEYARLRGWDK